MDGSAQEWQQWQQEYALWQAQYGDQYEMMQQMDTMPYVANDYVSPSFPGGGGRGGRGGRGARGGRGRGNQQSSWSPGVGGDNQRGSGRGRGRGWNQSPQNKRGGNNMNQQNQWGGNQQQNESSWGGMQLNEGGWGNQQKQQQWGNQQSWGDDQPVQQPQHQQFGNRGRGRGGRGGRGGFNEPVQRPQNEWTAPPVAVAVEPLMIDFNTQPPPPPPPPQEEPKVPPPKPTPPQPITAQPAPPPLMPPQPQQLKAPEHKEEVSEAEKEFDLQFKNWEDQFNTWKEENKMHPDKQQYDEYEKKMELFRAQLLNRREQMKKKREAETKASQSVAPVAPAVKAELAAFTANWEKPPPEDVKPKGKSIQETLKQMANYPNSPRIEGLAGSPKKNIGIPGLDVAHKIGVKEENLQPPGTEPAVKPLTTFPKQNVPVKEPVHEKPPPTGPPPNFQRFPQEQPNRGQNEPPGTSKGPQKTFPQPANRGGFQQAQNYGFQEDRYDEFGDDSQDMSAMHERFSEDSFQPNNNFGPNGPPGAGQPNWQNDAQGQQKSKLTPSEQAGTLPPDFNPWIDLDSNDELPPEVLGGNVEAAANVFEKQWPKSQSGFQEQEKARPNDNFGPPGNTGPKQMGQFDDQRQMGQFDDQRPMGRFDDQRPMGQFDNQRQMGQFGDQRPMGRFDDQRQMGQFNDQRQRFDQAQDMPPWSGNDFRGPPGRDFDNRMPRDDNRGMPPFEQYPNEERFGYNNQKPVHWEQDRAPTGSRMEWEDVEEYKAKTVIEYDHKPLNVVTPALTPAAPSAVDKKKAVFKEPAKILDYSHTSENEPTLHIPDPFEYDRTKYTKWEEEEKRRLERERERDRWMHEDRRRYPRQRDWDRGGRDDYRDRNDFQKDRNDFQKDRNDFQKDRNDFQKDRNDFQKDRNDYQKDRNDFHPDRESHRPRDRGDYRHRDESRPQEQDRDFQERENRSDLRNKDSHDSRSQRQLSPKQNQNRNKGFDNSSPRPAPNTSNQPKNAFPSKIFNIPEEVEKTGVEELLCLPGRVQRPSKFAIFMRGPPGCGKSHVAKLIKDKEVAMGGNAPRILSLDDYFMTEVETEVQDVETNRKIKTKEMKYEYEAEMEGAYRASLVKAFRKTIDEGYFPIIIVDCVNDKVKQFEEMWQYANAKGFKTFVADLHEEVSVCASRNEHNRTQQEIEKIVAGWEVTPTGFARLEVQSLLNKKTANEADMEEVSDSEGGAEEVEPENPFSALVDLPSSKWDAVDTEDKLDKLDGIKKRSNKEARSMDDWLGLEELDDAPLEPGKKRVRWADIVERKEQEKMRAIGFVVGQTDWSRMMDPTLGSGALTRTKYI